MHNNFDQEKHIYTIDGEVVPSVTQVLPKQKFFVSEEHLKKITEEGTDNHSYIKMFHDTGNTFNKPELEDLKKLYIEHQYLNGEKVCWEKSLYDPVLKFAGTPDLICEKSIIDFKRSFSYAEYHALQMAGYNLLRKENKLGDVKTWLILWWDNGRWKVRNVYNDMAELIFKECLWAWHGGITLDIMIKKYLKR